MKYLQWNHAIGEFFFNPNEAGNEVFLYITQKQISELGIKHFGFTTEEKSWKDFCTALKGEFPGTKLLDNFMEKFALVARRWKTYETLVFQLNKKDNQFIDQISIFSPTYQIVYPFYLGYLISFVISLTDRPVNFRINSFFPSFNHFLRLNEINETYIGRIDQIDWVWRDLEKWSSEYNKTDFGFFKERRLGNQNWVYVNKIFSQCLLTPKNIRNIPKIFWQARVAPNSIITEKQLLRIIELYGQSHGGFEKRVITLVNDENNPLRKVIIDIIRREYIKWKGYVLEYEGDNTSTPKSGWVYSTLLSAFNLNRVEESLNLFYYLFSQNDFPEELNFGGYEIISAGNGYSKPISISFNQNLDLLDHQNMWRATTTQNEIVIYTLGSYFGLPSDNLIETEKISRQSLMYLLCADSKRQSIEDWGATFLDGDFSLVDYDNVPFGFNLYKFKNPPSSHPTEEI